MFAISDQLQAIKLEQGKGVAARHESALFSSDQEGETGRATSDVEETPGVTQRC